MTFEESAALMKDQSFIDRVKAAALTYATGLNAQANLSRGKQFWCQQTFVSPDGTASQLIGPVVMNVNVQAAGAAITDPDLQAAVQVVADSMM